MSQHPAVSDEIRRLKAPNPDVDPAAYLRSIYAVRERSKVILDKAKEGRSQHFRVDLSKFKDAASYVVSIIKRDFAPDYSRIPPHGRWQHFDVGDKPRVDDLIASWPKKLDAKEKTRRLIDLFLVSVLLDAGAGNYWSYQSKEDGQVYHRSEGLAVASLDMFKAGLFSSDPKNRHQVDSQALKSLSADALATGLQASAKNPIEGLRGRAELLNKLGDALKNEQIFGTSQRPGGILDYLLAHPSTVHGEQTVIPLPLFWDTLMDGLVPIWPATRTRIAGVALGDAWPCMALAEDSTKPWQEIVPFHKLTQWLTYSLMVPIQKLMNVYFAGIELMTGLPEYRNGGLLVDTGVLTLKPADKERGIKQWHENIAKMGQPEVEVVPLFTAEDDVIVEWRALTVGFLDDLLVEVNELLELKGAQKLSLAQMLEAGSWKGGREVAKLCRPNTKGPPIMILSDGTVF